MDVSTSAAIELRNVTLMRGGRALVQEMNWSVRPGSLAAILGPNGSGKSTLARIISGYLFPTSGEVRVLGRVFGESDLNELRQELRLVQPAGPYDVEATLTAAEVVATGYFGTIGLYADVTPAMQAEADRLLKRVGLAAVADHPYSTLSSGERVRMLIARALVQSPRLLLLDEPTSGLDLLAREQVLATVQSLHDAHSNEGVGPTILLITHHVEELPPTTGEVLLLDEGRIAAAGPMHEVLTAARLSAVYRVPVEVNQRNGRYSLHVSPEAWSSLLADRR